MFTDNELDKHSTVAKFATVQKEGSRLIERSIDFYNLDVIISVGYRVKSQRGVQFRQWATSRLKDYNGGFIVISHNDDFIQNICKEFWTLENGTLNVHGDQEWMTNQLKTQVDFKVVDEIVDSMGNIQKVKQIF